MLTGDTLAASTSGTSITTSYSASTGVLSLTGSDTLAHYQQVLDSVSYSSTSQNPTNFGADLSRTVSWLVNDGTNGSQAQTTTVNVTAAGAQAPTGFSFTPATSGLQALQGGGSNLAASTQIGTFSETGGVAGDSFTYTVLGEHVVHAELEWQQRHLVHR